MVTSLRVSGPCCRSEHRFGADQVPMEDVLPPFAGRGAEILDPLAVPRRWEAEDQVLGPVEGCRIAPLPVLLLADEAGLAGGIEESTQRHGSAVGYQEIEQPLRHPGRL